MNIQTRYLLDRDPTERDIAEMHRWSAIKDFEVERVARVLDYFIANRIIKLKPKLRAVKSIRVTS